MTSLTWDRHQGHAYSYDVVDLGYNYRIDELRSALGLVQLSKLEAGNARRAALTREYWHALWTPKNGHAAGLDLPFSGLFADEQSAAKPAYHIFPALLPPGTDRQAFIDQLRLAGVQTSIHYPPVHTFEYYRRRYPDVSLPETEAVAARQVTLPLYPTMSAAQLNL